jgi:sialidase-1
MSRINSLQTGVLYRNPIPHVFSRQAYFPSVVQLAGGDMVATFSIGQAFESSDLHTYSAQSKDFGETWSEPVRLYPGTTDRVTSDVSRITLMPNGEIVAFTIRHDRSRADYGFANPDNLGFVDVELLLFRSKNCGATWLGPELIAPPLVGPSFEMTSPIVSLRDGHWLLPTSTWRGWDGYCPNGMKMVGFLSGDQGRTWPAYLDVMADSEGSIIYWESKIIELADGRLLAAAWAYDEARGIDLPNQYAISPSISESFSLPRSTGLIGQTLNLAELPNGLILTVYRRTDEPGLWANLSRIEDNEWVNELAIPLWGQHKTGLTSHRNKMTENFAALRFGAPSICRLEDGTFFVAYWAVEDGVSSIHWCKLQIAM